MTCPPTTDRSWQNSTACRTATVQLTDECSFCLFFVISIVCVHIVDRHGTAISRKKAAVRVTCQIELRHSLQMGPLVYQPD
ncbi:hypothetical protein PBRA_008477 [Plasmodiophora brassicae]|uniref:Uncharacterized protein n=1 Tax=Plasmodiophora brassicae TaxID=37360 RepID=A0A0G4J0T7_PLABS|nr:hypothetical protein PBRA_008477 [Plasmodiophora brassicae]